MLSSSAVPVVCAVLARDGQVLLAQRPDGKQEAGFWEFPGGKIEVGEEPAEALRRELSEELGCAVAVTEPGPVVVHQYAWGSVELRPYLCHLLPDSGEPRAHEHADLVWVSLRDLEKRPLAPADVPLLPWVKRCLGEEATQQLNRSHKPMPDARSSC